MKAFAAVGASSFLSWLPTSMLMGLSQGFGVLLAQRFGAGDREGLRRATLLSAAMASVAALAMTALGIGFLTPLLVAVQTPAEMMAYSADYLRVVFSGLLATGLYNVAACALRARGDSRSPLIALVISTLLNIALDWALVALADMGVEGVALATVIAQCASLAYCGAQMRRTPAFPPAAVAPMTSGIAARLLKLGLPPMVRDGVVAVGGLFVQRAVNGFGTAFVAGMTAAQRYFSMLELVGAGLDGSLATFVAQNAGAGNRDRIAEGTRSAVRFGVVASIVTAVLAAAGWRRGGGGRRLWRERAAVYGAVSAGAVPAVHLPRRASGHGGFDHAHDLGLCRTGDAHGKRNAAAAADRPGRGVYRKRLGMAARGGGADGRVLCPQAEEPDGGR